jgi:hypothetical protein
LHQQPYDLFFCELKNSPQPDLSLQIPRLKLFFHSFNGYYFSCFLFLNNTLF